MRNATRQLASIGLAAAVVAATSTTAIASTEDYKEIVSSAGIKATQIAPSGLSDAELDAAIHEYQTSQPSTLATGQYYSYCEEGSSGLMNWTKNDPKNCYGWYYEYLDGNRISKVNMLKLKAYNEDLNPATEVQLKEWCDNNGFYCSLVFAAIPYVGKYLRKLIV